MKKQFSKILIITIIFALLSCLFYFIAIINSENNESLSEMNTSFKDDLDAAREDGGVDDVEGYGLIVTGACTGLANLAGFLALLFLGILLPLGTLTGITILQIAARLFQIGETKKWKNITSTVLTIISLVSQFLTMTVFLWVAIMFKFSLLASLIIVIGNIIYGYYVIKELKNKETEIVEVV